MRLQLTTRLARRRLTLVAALATALGATSAQAEDRIDIGSSYFLEPAAKQQLNIVHPQFDAHIDTVPAFSINLGYNADVVTGATPRVYGKPMSAVDTVSQATHFSDVRHAFHGGVELRLGPTEIDAGYTYAFEHDYRSHAIDAAAKVDLWGKNTTFKLAYAHNFDSVCDIDNSGATPLERRALSNSSACFTSAKDMVTHGVAIDGYSLSWSQVLTPILTSELSVGMEVVNGFQSNPYRLVRLFQATVTAQESEPYLRERLSVQERLRIAVTRLRGAVGALARYYTDNWGIQSLTTEISYDQYLTPSLLVRLRGRFYEQGRAKFYRDAGETLSYESVGPVGQYFTGDRELSPFRDYLIGLKFSYLKTANERGKVLRLFEALDVNVKADLLHYEALTPLPPNLARYQDGFLSALIVQLNLSARW